MPTILKLLQDALNNTGGLQTSLLNPPPDSDGSAVAPNTTDALTTIENFYGEAVAVMDASLTLSVLNAVTSADPPPVSIPPCCKGQGCSATQAGAGEVAIIIRGTQDPTMVGVLDALIDYVSAIEETESSATITALEKCKSDCLGL